MSFDVSITYGAVDTPIAIAGTVLPEETAESAVNITVRLPKEHGVNHYCVRITSTEREQVNIHPFLVLAPGATPTIEVEALAGDFAHAVMVQARIADGPVVRDTCPMGCAVLLEPIF
jgi:hypothetical protein